MNKRFVHLLTWLLIVQCAASGCTLRNKPVMFDPDLSHYDQLGRNAQFPDVENIQSSEHISTPRPRTVNVNAMPENWRPISLDEAVEIALAHSAVLRDLGGTVIRSPVNSKTGLNPGIVGTDPRVGMEAALSAFDAVVSGSVIAEKNNRMVNNFVSTGGTRFFDQDLDVFQAQVTKTGVAGTQTTLRGSTTYDANNASFNKFPSTWDTIIEAEVRQPLLQGAGANFNRIAGPGSTPGAINGVVIARLNTDMSSMDFEIGIRDLISNVESTYWDLYYAYRDLDAKVAARNAALDLWRRIHAMYMAGQAGGSAEREAQAREQYFRFEEDVQNALSGRLFDATTTYNGSNGGTFRANGGVLVAERKLRLAMGIPITDDTMLRPSDEPTMATVDFDWGTATADAFARRPELARQRLMIKRRELEVLASRNFLMPRLDFISRYRWRGLGKDLIGSTATAPDPTDPENLFANSSLNNLFGGKFQEWQLGAELNFPVGFRRAHAAVANAQMLLRRDRNLLEEQERQVIHDLSNAIAELDRTDKVMKTSFNRRVATQQQVEILRDKLNRDLPVNLDQMLDSERRFADADIQYHRAMVEHMLALRNVHYEKGTLLDYTKIQMAENFDPATGDYKHRRPKIVGHRESKPMSYVLDQPRLINSSGDAVPRYMPGESGPGTAVALMPGTTEPQSPPPLSRELRAAAQGIERVSYDGAIPQGAVLENGAPNDAYRKLETPGEVTAEPLGMVERLPEP